MKYDDFKKMIDNIASDISKLQLGEKQNFKRKIEANEISGIIDVSLDLPEKIPPRIKNNQPMIKDYRYWILKLDRHYKSKAMRINQLNVAALKIYAKLCDCLEIYLNDDGTTVAMLVSKLRRETVNFDLYYTIYLIAETQVLNFYNPLSKKSAEKSYKIIEHYIDHKARVLLENKANELQKHLKPADKQTREYFNLTNNNQVSLWWDPKGNLRRKYKFSKDEQIAIDQISKRSNVLWNNKKVFDLLMDLYLSTLKELFDCKQIDTKKLIKIIKPYKQSKDILDAILIISENNLRKKFSFYGKISIQKSLSLLEEKENREILSFIENYQYDYLKNMDSKMVDDIYRDYFKNNPNKLKDFLKYFLDLSIDSKIDIIKEYERYDNFEKILNELERKGQKEDKIIGLYYIYKNNVNKNNHDKYLLEIIDKSNYDQFLKIVKEKELTRDVINQIISLQKKAPKKIKIDNKKIDISRKNLNKTVSLVNDFFDQEDTIDIEDNNEDIVQVNDESYNNILKKILYNDYMSTDEMEKLAKNKGLTLNTFIGNINESLYDYIGDQTLVIEDDKIIIDEFYIDMIKEYVNGSKN
ncbi:MAG: tellurite resistance TerB C-terminal domain-containing protein [Anaerococcus sp.]|uniref:tellurite resistance TerB C-terminal domain-containing protein n=2 Tax=Anaerococcus TaxID=165779 RepID=UPI0029079C2D|nr:tellurite resistance TerB C-terminal domain-containing protein [Anaerococcus sp.]MDU4025924.1 tellurite resistance TerB C-terminal domain-containing protein [Anaerococcus sp.]